MSKIDLETLATGYMDVQLINRNFERIGSWSDTILSRLGTQPNQMEADIDLNGHQLLNSSVNSTNPNGLVTFASLTAYVDQRASGIVQLQRYEIAATPGQTTVDLPTFSYEVGANNLSVYVDGLRAFAPTDFTEVDRNTISFLTPFAGGEKLVLLSTEFIGTTALPAHTHAWTDIFGAPETAGRWPTWAEVTSKPTSFPPDAHTHTAGAIISGRLADAVRGVYVQSGAPSAPSVGDVWFW